MELFSNIMDGLVSLSVPLYLLGDFNLDALNYGNSAQVTEYIAVCR
jgi:hypothetical protein